MNFLELVKKRYSARDYSPKAVEQEKVDYILECARRAPSAVNHQPWQFIVAQSDEARRLVQQCYPRDWFVHAPLYIIIYTKVSEAWVRSCDGKNHADIDAAIATDHVCLASADQGLGSCWVCNFDVQQLKTDFRLGTDEYPVAIVPIGYVNSRPDKFTSRKDVDELVSVR